MLKPLLLVKQGQHRRDRYGQGSVGSAGVLDRGKGTGRVAWKPVMSHSRPRGSEPAMGIAGRTMILARCGGPPPLGSAGSSEHEPRRNRVGTGSEPNK